MFNYNSQTWTPQTAISHSTDILNDINANLTSLGYTADELLKSSSTNAIWIMLLAQGDVRADYDMILNLAQNSLDPALCSDSQVLNLLTIAGTSLLLGTYTTVVITITALSSGDAIIPALSQLPFTNGIYFITPNSIIDIPAGTPANITVTASQRGAIVVAANQLTSFSGTGVTNIASITNTTGATGTPDETTTQARQRVIVGNTFVNNLNGLQQALEQLEGITSAVCYFNPDSSVVLTLPGSITIATRTLQVYVQGTSDLIGQTIFSTLMLKTQGGQSQVYTTLSGQSFTVYFDYSTLTTVYVKIIIPDGVSLADSVKLAIQNLILTLNPTIGQSIDSSLIDQLFIGFTGCEIIGSLISLDNTNFYQRVTINGNSVASFSAANIVIVNF